MKYISTDFLKIAYLVLCFSLLGSITQAQTVSGVITDANSGESLPGVNILVKDTSTGTATDNDGKYELSVPSLQDTLVFSFVGYQTQNIPINGRTTINVVLEISELIVDELVVVGYGTQRRGDLTGSIGSINERDFNRGLSTSPEQLLQGKLAGVDVLAQSGQPGAKQTVTIRGPGTVRSGSGPLYVIDGVAIDNSDTAPPTSSFGMSSASPTNPLAFLNPNDIESIDVLKDASATAIYGSRGSEGVILITTKRGESGPSQLNFTSNLTVSDIANKIDMLSPEEFADFQSSVGQSELDNGHRTDFFKEILQTGISQDHSISYSGGTETAAFYASVNFSDQEGIIKGSGLERYGGRLRVDQHFLENRLNIGINLTANRTTTNYAPIGNNPGVSGDMLSAALTLNPTNPTHNPDGTLFLASDNNMNPLNALELVTNFSEVTRVLGNLEASFEIVRGLEYRLNLGIDNSNGTQIGEVARHGVFRLSNPEGRLEDSRRENSNFQTESTLNYMVDLDAHSFNFLGGFSYQKFTFQNRSFSINDFSTTEIQAYRNPGIGQSLSISQNRPSGSSSVNELQSFFGRVNYNFQSKYFLTATMRADGSSRFGENNRYGIFPSFSAGWSISDESFMNVDALSNLRLRAGWGQSGNQEIPNGITQQLLNVSTGSGSGFELIPGTITQGITFVRTQNEDIQWEVSTQTNIGLDFAFFEDALYGMVDVFRKVSSDILFERRTGVDPITPTDSFWTNLDMEIINKGVEAEMGFRQALGTDFSFDVSGNISFINNEVRDMPVSQILTGAISGQGLSGERVQAILNGHSIGTFFLIDFEGFDEDGLNIFRDVDGDNSITNSDRIVAGNALPDYTYGISTDLAFRNWDLSLNFNGSSGSMVYFNDHNGRFTMPQLYGGNNIARIGFDPNESSINSAAASTRFLHDASYFRLNNATLGYNVNTANLPWLRGLRLSVTGQNLFTITDYPGFDPEVDTPRAVDGIISRGIDATRYPTARSVMFTLNLTL